MKRPAPGRDTVRPCSSASLAIVFGVLATAVSAAGSWIPSLWGDEVTSIMSAERSLPSLFRMLGNIDAVHGTYYLGLHFWGEVFGFSPFSVRFPSAIAVGLATAAVVLVAGRLRGRRVAVIAGIACALLPRATYMGEEARSFAFSAAVAAWLTLLLIVALEKQRPRAGWWIAYGALLAVGTYLFLYTLLFLVVHAIVIAVARPGHPFVRRWLVTAGCAIVASAPILFYAFVERGQISYLGATEQLAPQTLYASLWFELWPFATAAWVLIVIAIAVAVRRRELIGSGRPSLVFVGLTWLLVPTLALIAASVVTPDFTARYVSFCAPAAAILLACGLDELFRLRVWLGAVAAVVALALVVPVYTSQRTLYAKNSSDWAEMSAAVGSHARPGDAVVFDETSRPSYRPRMSMRGYPAGYRSVRDVTIAVPFQEAAGWRDEAYSVRRAAQLGRFAGVERVWLIEYASSATKADTYGVADLQALGFRPSPDAIHTYRGLITLYTR